MPSSTNSYVPSHIPVVLQNHLSHNVTYFKSSPSLIYVCTLSDLNPRHVLHSFPPSCPNLPSLLPFQYPSQIIHLIASFSSLVLFFYLLCPNCLLHYYDRPLFRLYSSLTCNRNMFLTSTQVLYRSIFIKIQVQSLVCILFMCFVNHNLLQAMTFTIYLHVLALQI